MAESPEAMTSASILRHHSKYQVSFTGISPVRCTSPQQPRRITHVNRKPTSPTRSQSETRSSQGGGLKNAMERLDSRRVARRDRVRPWQEKQECRYPSQEKLMLFYERTLPIHLDKTKVRYKTRRYVSNSKYGNIYEIRQEVRNKKGSTPVARHWIWEDEFQFWQKEKHMQKHTVKHSATSFLPLTPTSSSTSTSPRTSKCGSLPAIREYPNRERPSADLYARFNYHRLERCSRRLAAIVVQKVFRGWYVRHCMQMLKRKVLLEHSQTWSAFLTGYRELVTKVQSRYGVMKTSCPMDLKQIRIFLDRKLEMEKSFRLVAVNGKLHKKDLMEFFNRADMWPAQSDINRSFDTIFRGSRNTTELVFLIDCSSRCENVGFYDVIKFVKGLVISLDVGPDRVRVGVVPFTDDVINYFGVTTYKTKLDVLKALSSLRSRGGLTRTDLALKMLRSALKGSRPGVQQVAVLLTDGKSLDPSSTRQEATLCHQADIQMFTVGIGPIADENELKTIASAPDMVFRAQDVHGLRDIQQKIMARLCYAACGFCQHVLPRTVKQGLVLPECLEMVWTTYPPLACNLDRCKRASSYTIDSNDLDLHRDSARGTVDALDLKDALDLVWTVRPPEACGLDQVLASRWVRPVIDGKEAWAMLDESIIRATGMKACLRLVIQSKLARHGYVILPSDVKEGVEQVTTETAAMHVVERFLKSKQIECQ